MSGSFLRFRSLLAIGIIFTVSGSIGSQAFGASGTRKPSEDTERVETDETPFREVLIDRIIAGNLDCDFKLRTEVLACLAFQAAVGTYEAPSFTVTKKQSYAAHYEKISTLYAIEMMNQIVTVLPGSRYMLGYRVLGLDVQHPGTDAELCLDLGYGACGNHTATFLELMRLLDIEARPVQFFYSTGGKHFSHIASEALLGRKWRFFDLTWGAFYADGGDILNIHSISELTKFDLSQLNSTRVSYETNLFGRVELSKIDIHRYIYLNHSLIYGYDAGEVFISRDRFNDGKIDLGDIITFVGDNNDDGPFEGIHYALDNPELTTMSVSVSGIGGCSQADQFCLNGDCRAIHAHPYEFRNIPAGAQLQVKSELPVCYVVLNSIEFDPVNPTPK